MIPQKIEHLGIAVPSIAEALPYYEGVLGMTCYAIEEVADQKVKTAFLKVGDQKIQARHRHRNRWICLLADYGGSGKNGNSDSLARIQCAPRFGGSPFAK